MYTRLNTSDGATCLPGHFSHTAINCTEYIYDRSEFTETLTSELDLVCNEVGKRHLLGSIMMVGLTLGSLLGGPIGDRWGRKRGMFAGVFVVVPCVLAGAFVGESYLAYVFLRLVTCTCIVFSWINSHSFVMEYFGKDVRAFANSCTSVIAHTTGFVLPAVVYFFRDW